MIWTPKQNLQDLAQAKVTSIKDTSTPQCLLSLRYINDYLWAKQKPIEMLLLTCKGQEFSQGESSYFSLFHAMELG